MSCFKLLSAVSVIIFIFGMTIIDIAVAGEKVKEEWHAISHQTRWEKVETGVEKGHMFAIYENRSIMVNETTGEKSVDRGFGIMEIGPKPGMSFIYGYGVQTFKNGDTMIRSVEGKVVGKGVTQGTWTIIKCTGTLEGTKGGGNWKFNTLAPKQGFIEVEAELEKP